MRNSAGRDAALHGRLGGGHEGEGGVAHIERGVDDQRQQLACTRAGDRELRPLVADGDELHVEIGPQHLMAELHVLVDARRVGGGGGHEETVGAEPGGGAVVHDEAVLAQHHAVAGAADAEGGEGVDVEAVEEGAGVRALHVDLAERGDVAEADRGAHGCHLAADGGEPVGFARLRIPLRAQPGAGFDEHRALLLGPGVRRRTAGRAEVLAAVVAGERADRNRRVGRAEGGGADLGDRAAGQRRHDAERRQVGGLALVGGHAERGVALQVLDGAEALAMGKRDVVGGDVVLQVDEGLGRGAGDMPQRGDGEGLVVGAWRRMTAWRA